MDANFVMRICEEKGVNFEPVNKSRKTKGKVHLDMGFRTKGKVYLDTLTEIVNACISADQDDEPFSGPSTDD